MVANLVVVSITVVALSIVCGGIAYLCIDEVHAVYLSQEKNLSHRSRDFSTLVGNAPDLSSTNAAIVCKEIWKQALLHDGQHPEPFGWSKNNRGLPRDGKPRHELVIAVGKSASNSFGALLQQKHLLERFVWIHMHPVKHETLNDKTLVVVNVRDPVERLASAFKHLYTEEGSWRANGYTGPDGAQRIFFDCFPSLGKFADSLDVNTVCGANARSSLVNIDLFRKHFNKGLCYYVGGLLDEINAKALIAKVAIVESNSLSADFNKLVNMMGLNSSHLNPDDEVPHTHDNKHAPISTKLTSEQHARLKRHLAFEYVAYDAMKQLRKLA